MFTANDDAVHSPCALCPLWSTYTTQTHGSMRDTLPHTVVGVCGEFQWMGHFLQRAIWSQCVVPRSVVPSVCSSLCQLPDRTEQVLTRAGRRVEVVASLAQGRTAAAQCVLFKHKSVPVIFEPPCVRGVSAIHVSMYRNKRYIYMGSEYTTKFALHFFFFFIFLSRFLVCSKPHIFSFILISFFLQDLIYFVTHIWIIIFVWQTHKIFK